MTTPSTLLNIYSVTSKKNIAKVQLNGYKISAKESLEEQGALRSFSISSGDLWDAWSYQEVLLLHDGKSRKAKIKIAALPTEEDSYGLLEFL